MIFKKKILLSILVLSILSIFLYESTCCESDRSENAYSASGSEKNSSEKSDFDKNHEQKDDLEKDRSEKNHEDKTDDAKKEDKKNAQSVDGVKHAGGTKDVASSKNIDVAKVSQDSTSSMSNAKSSVQDLNKRIANASKAVVKISAFFPSMTSSVAYKGGGRLNTSGSGFIIKHNGEYYVITNAHIVVFSKTLTASLIQISTWDDEVFDCKMVGFSSDMDIAVLKINIPKKSKKQFHSLSFKLGTVEVGDEIIAIGAPNNLENTMSFGRISHVKREVGLVPYYCYQIENFAVPGSSGSPAMDKDCKVMGMIFASAHSGGNLSFVIPKKVIELVFGAIIDSGKFDTPRIGIAISYMNKQILSKCYSLDHGISVANVVKGASADGVLAPGDLITKVHGKEVKAIADVFETVAFNNLTSVEIEFLRKNEKGEVKKYSKKISVSRDSGNKFFECMGLVIENVGNNVVVNHISPNARVDSEMNKISQMLTLDIGMLKIKYINGKKVRSVKDCIAIVKNIAAHSDYAMVVFSYLDRNAVIAMRVR